MRVGNNPVNFVDPLGLEVIYGNIVVSNPLVRNALERLNATLPNSDIIVTGGDRYIDKNGNIRSSSNNQIISNSAPKSTHLEGLAVDFEISNLTPTKELILEFFDWVKMDYADRHIHGDLRNTGRICK